MYAAKEGGRGHLLFEQQLDRYSPRRLSLAGALRSAIADGEIVLFYQPKAELHDRQASSASRRSPAGSTRGSG